MTLQPLVPLSFSPDLALVGRRLLLSGERHTDWQPPANGRFYVVFRPLDWPAPCYRNGQCRTVKLRRMLKHITVSGLIEPNSPFDHTGSACTLCCMADQSQKSSLDVDRCTWRWMPDSRHVTYTNYIIHGQRILSSQLCERSFHVNIFTR